jgi:endonuclease/exonuclease/phosphatase family metal-dependent hydrolase
MHGAAATRGTNQLADTLRFASYNIHLGIGRDGIFRPERTAAVIDELDADVVALQEVSLGGPGFDMLDYLRRKCGLNAIAGPTLLSSRGEFGNAILTRLHHGEVQRWDLSVGVFEPRGAIDTRVAHGGHSLRVIATHLGLRPGERRRQIRQLLKIIETDNRFPTVLLGDVNEWFLWGRPLRWMHRHFKRTPAPPTFPAGRPLFALDRIWVEPRSALQRIRVHASATARIASDHLPIVASVDFGLLAAGMAKAAVELATE